VEIKYAHLSNWSKMVFLQRSELNLEVGANKQKNNNIIGIPKNRFTPTFKPQFPTIKLFE
jgi:hypothetical protein